VLFWFGSRCFLHSLLKGVVPSSFVLQLAARGIREPTRSSFQSVFRWEEFKVAESKNKQNIGFCFELFCVYRSLRLISPLGLNPSSASTTFLDKLVSCFFFLCVMPMCFYIHICSQDTKSLLGRSLESMCWCLRDGKSPKYAFSSFGLLKRTRHKKEKQRKEEKGGEKDGKEKKEGKKERKKERERERERRERKRERKKRQEKEKESFCFLALVFFLTSFSLPVARPVESLVSLVIPALRPLHTRGHKHGHMDTPCTPWTDTPWTHMDTHGYVDNMPTRKHTATIGPIMPSRRASKKKRGKDGREEKGEGERERERERREGEREKREGEREREKREGERERRRRRRRRDIAGGG